jgi:hypothetical protein
MAEDPDDRPKDAQELHERLGKFAVPHDNAVPSSIASGGSPKPGSISRPDEVRREVERVDSSSILSTSPEERTPAITPLPEASWNEKLARVLQEFNLEKGLYLAPNIPSEKLATTVSFRRSIFQPHGFSAYHSGRIGTAAQQVRP